MDRCRVTGKIRFPDKQSARAALHEYARKKGSTRLCKGRCIFCDGYHLTKGLRVAR